jgi:hypothetical protein
VVAQQEDRVGQEVLPAVHVLRGSGPSLPAKKIFCWAEDHFFRSAKNTQKTDRRRTKRALFLTKMRIAPPHRHDFTIDLQRRWSINHNIGDRQFTYYLIVRALTITVLLFFL